MTARSTGGTAWREEPCRAGSPLFFSPEVTVPERVREREAALDALMFIGAARTGTDAPPGASDPALVRDALAVISAELCDELDRLGGASQAVLERIYGAVTGLG